MIELTVSGNTREEAYAEGLAQLGVPREAVEVEELSSAHDDILPGAEPLPGVTLRFRVREDVLLKQAKRHLEKILELIGTGCTVEVLNRRRGPTLNILAGEDGSLVIGKNGQNLDALQYLINRMTVKSNRELAPIIVDSEGYHEKRLLKLEETAQRTAKKVLRSGREIALEPMPASNRKVIHIAIKEIRGVHGVSRGEENDRRVVISPAKGEAPPPNVFRGRPGRTEERGNQDNQRGGGRRSEGRGEGRRGEGRNRQRGRPERGGQRRPEGQPQNQRPAPNAAPNTPEEGSDEDTRFNR